MIWAVLITPIAFSILAVAAMRQGNTVLDVARLKRTVRLEQAATVFATLMAFIELYGSQPYLFIGWLVIAGCSAWCMRSATKRRDIAIELDRLKRAHDQAAEV